MAAIPQPWLQDSLEQLDLRQRDRCLVLSCPTTAHVAAVAHVVGRTAAIVVVEPDSRLAELAARDVHQNLEVLAYTPRGGERFGTFDALLACPLTTLGWPVSLWCDLIPRNLRPGGRFVLDLPAEVLCDPLRRTWAAAGGDPAALAPITGPSESVLAGALREAGLRNVEAAMGTHLARLGSPFQLGHFLRDLGLEEERVADAERLLVELLRTAGEVDVILHRTRVRGRR